MSQPTKVHSNDFIDSVAPRPVVEPFETFNAEFSEALDPCQTEASAFREASPTGDLKCTSPLDECYKRIDAALSISRSSAPKLRLIDMPALVEKDARKKGNCADKCTTDGPNCFCGHDWNTSDPPSSTMASKTVSIRNSTSGAAGEGVTEVSNESTTTREIISAFQLNDDDIKEQDVVGGQGEASEKRKQNKKTQHDTQKDGKPRMDLTGILTQLHFTSHTIDEESSEVLDSDASESLSYAMEYLFSRTSCKLCGLRLDVPKQGREHMKAHGPQPYLHCTVCRKLFTGPQALREHMQKHSPGKLSGDVGCEKCLVS